LYEIFKQITVFNAIPEDDNAKVTMIQNGKDYEIIVESPSGDYAVYILSPYKNMLIFYIILIILGFGCGYTTYYIKIKIINCLNLY
jgi:hypothetical protein